MKKVKLTWHWPVEEGHYLLGNYFSPVAVAVSLIHDYEKIPREVEDLVRAGIEKGAAISGTLQTANIGIEKIVLNIVSNPNIRWLILVGPTSKGHKADDALKALVSRGIDDRGYILHTRAPTAILKNISRGSVERLREQVSLVDLSQIEDPEVLKEAVWGCYQQEPTVFAVQGREYELRDPGALPTPPIIERITDRLKESV